MIMKRSESRTAVPFLTVLAAFAVMTALPAGAQLQAPAFRNLELNGDLELVVDGEKVADAEIYASQSPPAILVMAKSFPAPVMVFPGGGRVETINLMKLAKRPSGAIDVLPQATLKPQGQYQIDGQSLVFSVEGRSVRLDPKAPLLGLHPAADLKEYSPLYVKRAESYRPDSPAVSLLQEQGKAVKVRVFFGSWCPTCQRVVPNAIRLAEELAGSKVRFEFYGLPQGFKGEPEATKYEVHAVPTAVVFVDGKEVGRIEGNRWLQPEVALRDILNGGGTGK